MHKDSAGTGLGGRPPSRRACSRRSGAHHDGLYAADEGDSTSYTWVYGPEDLAVDRRNDWLWSVSEHPGERYVFAVDLSDVGG